MIGHHAPSILQPAVHKWRRGRLPKSKKPVLGRTDFGGYRENGDKNLAVLVKVHKSSFLLQNLVTNEKDFKNWHS